MPLPTDRLELPSYRFRPADSPLVPSLSTHWEDLGQVPPGWTAADPLAVAPDGSIWMSAGSTLWTYVPTIRLFFPVWAGRSTHLAAVSATEIWGVFTDSAGQHAWCGRLSGDGRFALPPLPDTRAPERIWVTPDGVIWVQGGGEIYRYRPGDQAWLPLGTGTMQMDVLSVGSPDNVWGLAFTKAGTDVFRFDARGGWVEVDGPGPLENCFAVVACPDGSAWLGSINVVLLKRSNEDHWTQIHSSDLSSKFIASYAAASDRGLVVVGGDTLSPPVGGALTIGVVDQPADDWPPQPPGDKAAYVAISQKLGISAEGGIRAAYPNSAERTSFSDWRSDLLSMKCPDRVNPPAFERVRTQLADELHCVHVVYDLFDNIRELNHQFTSLTGVMLPPIATMVGLSEQGKEKDADRIVHAVLGAMIQTAIGMMVGVVAGPAGQLGGKAIQLAYAGLKAGVDAATKGAKPPDYRLEIAYSKFAQSLADLFVQADQTNADTQMKILTTWGMLREVAREVDSGDWAWPVTASSEIVAAAKPGLTLFFYQSLMPAKWQIVHILAERSLVPIASIPQSAQFFTAHEENGQRTDYLDLWFCNELGSSRTVQDPMHCLFPSADLMKAVFEAIFDTQGLYSGFFQGKGGWSLSQA